MNAGGVSFVALIGLLPFVLAACTEATSSTDPRTQPPLVRIETVKISAPSGRSFTGVVAARVQSDLGFRVAGKVVERLVDTGQTVRRGQALMRIDPKDLRLALQAHEEAVAAAKARARQTALEESRYGKLIGAGAVSASAYEQVKAAAESARADLNAAQAQADVARNNTGYAILAADADGVVVETLAEPGQVVARGARGRHRPSRSVASGDRIPWPCNLVRKSAGRIGATSPAVRLGKPSDSNLRGSVRAHGSAQRRAARFDHLHPDFGRAARPGTAGADWRDQRFRQRSGRMAG